MDLDTVVFHCLFRVLFYFWEWLLKMVGKAQRKWASYCVCLLPTGVYILSPCPSHNPLPPIWSSQNPIFTEFVQPCGRFFMFQLWQQLACPQGTSLRKTTQSVFANWTWSALHALYLLRRSCILQERQWCLLSRKGVSCRRGRWQRNCVIRYAQGYRRKWSTALL